MTWSDTGAPGLCPEDEALGGVRLYHRGVGTDGGDDWAGTSQLEVTGDTLRASGIAELVILRDRHCTFPFCNRDARACDVDHITPYEENGPPGQTRPENLAVVCRRHHRAKTFRRWRYHRTPAGSYQWTGPHGQTYLVTRPAPSPSRPTETDQITRPPTG